MFPVSSDDILTPEEIVNNWPLVDKADRGDIASLVKHDVFNLDARQNPEANNVVDGVWVRRWKDRAKGVVRSRCCGRGFLDKQKENIDRHSSTASRLSHRLAVPGADTRLGDRMLRHVLRVSAGATVH